MSTPTSYYLSAKTEHKLYIPETKEKHLLEFIFMSKHTVVGTILIN